MPTQKINVKVVCPEETTEQEYFGELFQERLGAGIIRETASNMLVESIYCCKF
jgi:hypothetical protein